MAHVVPELFEDVNSVDASSATRRFARRRVQADEVVLAAGADGHEVVGVIEGRLEVRAAGVALAQVGPGALVGELALFEEGTRTAEVVALGPGEILVIPRSAYEELRDTAHPVAANLERVAMRHLAERLRSMDARIASLSQGEAKPVRVPGARFFAQVAAQFGRGGLFHNEGVDRMAVLARSGLVDDVPNPVLVDLAGRFGVQACGPGQILCTEGTSGAHLWLVESGEVEVLVATSTDGIQTLATLGAGCLIGAAALVQSRPRMASCVARTRVVALFLDGVGWREIVADSTLMGSALRRAVIRALSAQLAGANAMVQRFEQEHASAALVTARSRLVATPPPAKRG